jgi:hypothetical protein
MTFSDDYAVFLLPFIEKYKNAQNQKGRKEVLRNAAEAVMKNSNLREDKTVDLPKDLPTVCFYFIFSYL